MRPASPRRLGLIGGRLIGALLVHVPQNPNMNLAQVMFVFILCVAITVAYSTCTQMVPAHIPLVFGLF